MDGNQISLLGLDTEALWMLLDQRLDTDKQPLELHLAIKAEFQVIQYTFFVRKNAVHLIYVSRASEN